MNTKRKLLLDDYEHRVMVNALNHLRTALLKGDKDTMSLDNILLKVIRARGVHRHGRQRA